MNVLFLTLLEFDSLEERGIYTDLMREFVRNNHKVYIVSPFEKRTKKKPKQIKKDNYQILKLEIGNIQKTNFIEKGFSILMLEKKIIHGIKQFYSNIKFDLVLYSTPPITFQKAVEYIKKRDGASTYLLLKDIFPQNAVDLNMFGKKSLIYKYFRRKEKKLYNVSDYIGCMSQANVDFVINHNQEISPDKVEICPNSIEPLKIEKNEEIKNNIRNKFGIPIDKTVFIYGGNLGKPQGIDFVIDVLKANENNKNVYFVIAGSGTEFKKLQNYFQNNKPENAQLFEQLPKHDYELLANSSDVGLIFLDKKFTIPNFPSRLLSYMQASIPVLAATDPNTDVGKVIEEGEFGYWCISDNVNEFNDRLNKLCNKKLRENMGRNARKYLEENYTVDHSYNIIMRHFES